jgi:membrane-associated phospholipid phosphatase
MSVRLVLSYALDWFVVIAMGLVSLGLGELEPNKRPFSLGDPNISFPFTENETIPAWLLIVCQAIAPAVIVVVVCLIFVPGATVPRSASRGLVWRRKLWELQIGLLGLALSIVLAWFFTNGMKNLFGKPRPDLLSRCQPDLENAADFIVSPLGIDTPLASRLYSAGICQQSDHKKLDDGFRSYPSGHSSSAAAGLVYLSLFLASKFVVTTPFAVPSAGTGASNQYAAFPSRTAGHGASAVAEESSRLHPGNDDRSVTSSPPLNKRDGGPTARHNSQILSLRRQAAAPPVYLLVVVLVPFGGSIFIAASRWYDFRHHGFDILFGYLMGLLAAIYAFRYYHLPVRAGAGWAWGPRSNDRAFWAGVGRHGYVSDRDVAAAASSSSAEPRGANPRAASRKFNPQEELMVGGASNAHESTAYEPNAYTSPPSAIPVSDRVAQGGYSREHDDQHDVEMYPLESNRY